MTRGPSCFYIMDPVPQRHIDLASVICYRIMATLSFKIMKETLKSYVNILRIKFVMLWDLLNFGIRLS